MATTDFDFQSSRNDILSRAFRICGDLPQGEVLQGDQLVQGNQILNDMVKSWQADHIFLWSIYLTSLTTVAGTEAYSLSTDPPVIAIDTAYVTQNNVDIPLEVISIRQYQELGDKTTVTGLPRKIAVEWDRATATYLAYIWPSPDAVYTVPYQGIVRLKDFDTATSTGDFQPHWTNALVYGVAADLCDDLGLPMREREYLQGKAATYKTAAKRGDKPISDLNFVKPNPWS